MNMTCGVLCGDISQEFDTIVFERSKLQLVTLPDEVDTWINSL